MPGLTVDGVQLAYTERGTGKPLLLIHGTGFQTELWRSSLDDLSDRHRVIAYDRRGYGRSRHRPVRDYRRHVADAIEVIERVAEGPAVVVGHSSGASIALVVAAIPPDLVRALVVAEPPFHGLRYATGSFLGMVARAKLSQLRGRPQDAAAIFFRWATAYQSGGNAFDRLPVELRQLMLGNARSVIAEADPHPTGVLFEHVPTRALSGIRAPITFLLAQSSQPWFHRIHGRLLRAMPHIQTEPISGAGHYINSDAPAEFLAALVPGFMRQPGQGTIARRPRRHALPQAGQPAGRPHDSSSS